MTCEANIAAVAALIGDPARAAMLSALTDGRALPAGELAFASGVTAQTASAHLGRLLDGGLLSVETEGRHRYYRLAGPEVAQALEQLAALTPRESIRRRALNADARRLQFARCCYDHLAGRLGVSVADGLCAQGFIVPAAGKAFAVTPMGRDWFAGIGLDIDAVKPTRRGLARQCLDWTERRHHLAGPLGVRLLAVLCDRGWLRRSADSRAVSLTPVGYRELRRHLAIDHAMLLEQVA
ncbi:MAG: ArsR/SmtB family transcription factor [Pararhizobium sp.]